MPVAGGGRDEHGADRVLEPERRRRCSARPRSRSRPAPSPRRDTRSRISRGGPPASGAPRQHRRLVVLPVDDQRHLAGGRDADHRGHGEAEEAGVRRLRPAGVQLRLAAVPRRGVDDLAVGSEARAVHGAAAEGQPLVLRVRVVRGRAGQQEPGRGKGHDQRRQQRRAGALPRRLAGQQRGAGPGAGGGRKRLDVEREVVGGLEALGGVLLQAVVDDPLQRGGQGRVRHRHLRRLFLEDRVQRLDRRAPLEGALAGEHLVQDGAEREDVRPMVGIVPAHLLGRHVPDGSQDHPFLGVGIAGDGRAHAVLEGARERGAPELGEAEVEDLHPAVAGQEDVVGLEVAVDDPLLVGGGEAAGDLDRVVHHLARRQRHPAHALAEGLALQQLAHHVGRAGLVPDVVDGDDVRMVEGAGGPRLLLEPLEARGIGAHRGGENLDRDLAAQARVAGAVDLAHRARPEQVHDLVRPSCVPAARLMDAPRGRPLVS